MKRFSLEQAVQRYLEYRHQWGFALKGPERVLKNLVRYCQHLGCRGPLTNQIVLKWIQFPSSASRLWQAKRLAIVRRFTLFWVVFDPQTEIPPSGIFGPENRRSPIHLYSAQELSDLLRATRQWDAGTQLKGRTCRTVFGLLRSTGLRISEALHLQNGHLDWSGCTLTVHRSKFGKSRCLPLDPSVLAALKAYAQLRDRRHGKSTSQEAFFVNTKGAPLSYSQTQKAFSRLRAYLGWKQQPLPRLHDFRHTFAVETLLRWSAQKEELGSKVLALTTYLGHRSTRETYWYLSATPELLALGSARLAGLFEGGSDV